MRIIIKKVFNQAALNVKNPRLNEKERVFLCSKSHFYTYTLVVCVLLVYINYIERGHNPFDRESSQDEPAVSLVATKKTFIMNNEILAVALEKLKDIDVVELIAMFLIYKLVLKCESVQIVRTVTGETTKHSINLKLK